MDICEVCIETGESRTWKYKCPNCLIKYCSVKCWNKHKQTDCSKVAEEEENTKVDQSICTQFLHPTDDTVDPLMLEKLGQSEKLKSILKNPFLRKIIMELDKASNVKQLIQQAMLEPIFTEFADVCLQILEPSNLDQETQ